MATYGAVETGMRSDLRRAGLPVGSALARAGLVVARRIDAGDLEPRDLAVLTGRLESVLVSLAKVTPARPVKDGIDDLAARRAARRAG